MARFVAFLAFTLILFSVLAMAKSKPKDNRAREHDCLDVYQNFMPCIGFVEGIYPAPNECCCDGVRELNKIVKHNHDVQRVCHCIEFMARADHPPFLSSQIEALPNMCQTHLSFPISVYMDCDTLN